MLKLKDIVRSIDGSMNNLNHPDWGKSHTNIRRIAEARYEDGKGMPLENMPNARFISENIGKLKNNTVFKNEFNLTMLWGTWGQFLDHDITLTDDNSSEPLNIKVPRCDPFYDKKCTGKEEISIDRSEHDPTQEVRTNINQLTSWIDAGMVYGSTKVVNQGLRTFVDGKLKTSPDNLLPFDEDGEWIAGDIRVA